MWRDGFVELFFPARCAACDAPGEVLCSSCEALLPLIPPGRACVRCGAPMSGSCAECAGREFSFSACRVVGMLRSPLSDVVTVYKDAGERRLVTVIGALMAARIDDWASWADAVVPVPVRPASRSTRGFDHMRLVAADVAARTSLPLVRLLQAHGTGDQRRLGREDRFANASGRYAVCAGIPVPRRVLLLDDVFTTGATFEACSAALMAAGAHEVRVVALARAADGPDAAGCTLGSAT